MLVHQDAAQLGEALGRLLERGEDDRPLVERQGEQCDAVVERLLKRSASSSAPAALTIVVSSTVAAASTGTPASITGRA